MDPPDELDEYLRRDSTLSRRYRRESAPSPPAALDRRVLKLATDARRKPPCLAPLALAASLLLSVALVLAIVFGQPRTAKRADDAPHLVRVAAYGGESLRARPPSEWLAHIAALRRAGRNGEADAELRRFRNTYPYYAAAPQ
jgi:hypothetical protein